MGSCAKKTTSCCNKRAKRATSSPAPVAAAASSAKQYKNYKTVNARDGGAASTYGNKTLATLYYPFSMKNNSPKWPDGLATFSVGRKIQTAGEIIGTKELTLVVFPGMSNWFAAFDASQTNELFVKANHGSFVVPMIQTKRDFFRSFSYANSTDEQSFSAWRPVSTAVKFRHVNSDQDNEGWFEAIRTNRNAINQGFSPTLIQNGAPDSDPANPVKESPLGAAGTKIKIRGTDLLPTKTTHGLWCEATNWSTQPTYATGKLKDIGRYIFQLNNQKTENDFLKLRQISVYYKASNVSEFLDINGEAMWSAGEIAERLEDATAIGPDARAGDLTDFKNTFYSDAFDMIVIRIHGTEKTRILCHSVMNMELLVPENSPYAPFQTVAYGAPDALEAYMLNRQKYNKLPMHSAQQTYSNMEDMYFN